MVKMVSLSDEAYRILRGLKRDRSFSETVVEELGKRKRKTDIMKFCGIWDNEEGDKIAKELRETRKKAKLREVKL